MKTIEEVFEHTLQDIYWAENALAKALPKVIKAASNDELSAALSEHLQETKGHLRILEKVFQSIGKEATGVKCDAMDGLLKECDGILDEGKGPAIDAALIGAAQAVEHYEIARYGTLREWAKVLGHEEAHTLLSTILDEEKAANSKLTSLAVSAINAAARKMPKSKG